MKTRHLLFIDSNLYLQFYDSTRPEFKKLLYTLKQFKDNIFVTKQIVDEVTRNKLKVTLRSFQEYNTQFEFQEIRLPEHLQKYSENTLKDWNSRVRQLWKLRDKEKEELRKISDNLLAQVVEGKDEASVVLDSIFSKCKIPTDIEFSQAVRRKQIGNPPGKVSDPLGDQLSWEQLLNSISSINVLWLVTTDKDYCVTFKKKHYLDAYLRMELREKNTNLSVACFSSLAEALKELQDELDRDEGFEIISDNDLDKIIDEEKNLGIFSNLSRNKCPNCGLIEFVGPQENSQGRFYQCRVCSFTQYLPSVNFPWDDDLPF